MLIRLATIPLLFTSACSTGMQVDMRHGDWCHSATPSSRQWHETDDFRIYPVLINQVDRATSILRRRLITPLENTQVSELIGQEMSNEETKYYLVRSGISGPPGLTGAEIYRSILAAYFQLFVEDSNPEAILFSTTTMIGRETHYNFPIVLRINRNITNIYMSCYAMS